MSGWIGVDLDGTLALYDGWKDGAIGAPVPLMVQRVKKWLAEGKDIRIFTARVAHVSIDSDAWLNVVKPIEDWCQKHIGKVLPITCQKDYGMIELWQESSSICGE